VRRASASSASLLLMLVVCTTVVGCIPRRDPIYIGPELSAENLQIESIAFMPVIDVRPDPFTYVEISTQTRRVGTRILSRKGYEVIPEVLSTPDRKYTAGELAGMNEEELATLGSPERQTLLFVYVEGLEQGVDERGEGSRVTLSAVLIEKAGGRAIWRDRAVGDSNMTGLLTVLTGPSTEYEAVWAAVRMLFATLPSRKNT